MYVFLFHVHCYIACICVCVRCQISWNWSCRQLWTARSRACKGGDPKSKPGVSDFFPTRINALGGFHTGPKLPTCSSDIAAWASHRFSGFQLCFLSAEPYLQPCLYTPPPSSHFSEFCYHYSPLSLCFLKAGITGVHHIWLLSHLVVIQITGFMEFWTTVLSNKRSFSAAVTSLLVALPSLCLFPLMLVWWPMPGIQHLGGWGSKSLTLRSVFVTPMFPEKMLWGCSSWNLTPNHSRIPNCFKLWTSFQVR